MLDIQSFLRRTTVQLLARWLNITPFILQEVFPCVNYHIEEKKIYSVVSNEGKRRVIFQNEWNKGNVHKDLKLVGSMGTKKCKIQKANIILVFFLNYFIIWLQQNTCSYWLFSCDDWALQARCPRHIQSVFNLIVVIFMDIHVTVNWQLSKMVSADHDQCQLTVSWVQVYNSLSWHVFKSYPLTSCWF